MCYGNLRLERGLARTPHDGGAHAAASSGSGGALWQVHSWSACFLAGVPLFQRCSSLRLSRYLEAKALETAHMGFTIEPHLWHYKFATRFARPRDSAAFDPRKPGRKTARNQARGQQRNALIFPKAPNAGASWALHQVHSHTPRLNRWQPVALQQFCS